MVRLSFKAEDRPRWPFESRIVSTVWVLKPEVSASGNPKCTSVRIAIGVIRVVHSYLSHGFGFHNEIHE